MKVKALVGLILVLLMCCVTLAACISFRTFIEKPGGSAASGDETTTSDEEDTTSGTEDLPPEDQDAEELEYMLLSDGTYSVSAGEVKDLTVIEIPATHDGIAVTRISDYAFSGAENLVKITIPDSVTDIGEEAFSYCKSLMSIEIPNHVTSIGEFAFYYCKSLTNIGIPDSVIEIGDDAFGGCSSLESITIPFTGAAKNGTSKTHFGYIFGAPSKYYNSIYVPSSLKTVVVTGGASISRYVFFGCSNVTSIIIPDGVTSIGEESLLQLFGYYGHHDS